VRRFTALALAGAVFGLLIPTHAQSFTYGKLVAGQVKTALAYGTGSSWCLVYNGGSLFQINQAATKAVISFPEVIYYDSVANSYYSLDGQDILAFSSASSGTIRFKKKGVYPLAVNTPAFTDFQPDLQCFDGPADGHLQCSLSKLYSTDIRRFRCALRLAALQSRSGGPVMRI
jgi:hypothetical protein